MTHQTTIDGIKIDYSLRRSRRSLNLSISINHRGRVTITAPYGIPLFIINQFIKSRHSWIKNHLQKIHRTTPPKTQQHQEFIRLKPVARKLIIERLEYFNQFYNFRYHLINIKDHSSRWGSCSKKGNLNFNYRIAQLPSELADLIIVHELCHLKEMNHSPHFWNLVRKTIPNPNARRRRLDQMGADFD